MFDTFDFIETLGYLLCALVVTALLIVVNSILSKKIWSKTIDKTVSYECGFESFSSSRLLIDVDFFLILIFFILFDIEIIYLFPWVLSITSIRGCGHLVLLFFIALLVLGFYYEYMRGTLDWVNDILAY